MNPYCVYLEPKLEGLNQIQTIRKKYDPLAEMIPPHVTLVFPFKLDERESLLKHLNPCLNKTRAIEFTLGEPQIHADYVWLPVLEGAQAIQLLHKQLYSGILKEFLSTTHEYLPHITLGRFNDPKTLDQLLKDARALNLGAVGTFNKAILELVGDDNYGHIEKAWTLEL